VLKELPIIAHLTDSMSYGMARHSLEAPVAFHNPGGYAAAHDEPSLRSTQAAVALVSRR